MNMLSRVYYTTTYYREDSPPLHAIKGVVHHYILTIKSIVHHYIS